MIRKAVIAILLTGAAAAVAIGIVSFWKGIPDDGIWFGFLSPRPGLRVAMIRGTLHMVYLAPVSGPPRSRGTGMARIAAGTFNHQFGGFYIRSKPVMQVLPACGVGVPFWFVTATLTAYPALALIAGVLRRRRRRRRGLCIRCGYNLRGLSEPRCPECGKAFALDVAAVPS